jgi:hypothetical protein
MSSTDEITTWDEHNEACRAALRSRPLWAKFLANEWDVSTISTDDYGGVREDVVAEALGCLDEEALGSGVCCISSAHGCLGEP